MIPTLILGGNYKDHRGILKYNNGFDMSVVKRMYIIKNVYTFCIRAWQGHKIEQRWFSSFIVKLKIDLIKIDDLEKPSKKLEKSLFKYLIKTYIFYISQKDILVQFN